MPNKDIWFDQSKAAKQLVEKHEVSKDTLKEIPKVLENPIAIAESYDNTVLVFGKLYDDAGNPFVVAVRINSTNRRNNITQVNKIRSVGTRTHNLDSILKEENILYLGTDKKETKNWFNALGRSTPFGGTKFGLIRSVSFDSQYVKQNFSVDKDASELDEAYLNAVETRDMETAQRMEALFSFGKDGKVGVVTKETEWIKNQLVAGKEFVLYKKERADAFLRSYGYEASQEDGICSLKRIITYDK